MLIVRKIKRSTISYGGFIFNFTKIERQRVDSHGTLYSQSKMEGACGKILSTENPQVVLKKIHRRNRPQQRTSSLRAEKQAEIQEWARLTCEGSCKLLYVPRAWDAERFAYKMDRINTENPLPLVDVKTHPVLSEIKAFYKKAQEASVFPADYELYIQPDGRVAMVDFDKFASWSSDGSVTFPWGQQMSSQQVKECLSFFQ